MIEDITFDPSTNTLHTSDEQTYRFYAGKIIQKDKCNLLNDKIKPFRPN